MASRLDGAVDLVFAPPSADEAAEIRQAVAAAASAGGGFVQHYSPSTRRLFTAVIQADELILWTLEQARDERAAAELVAYRCGELLRGAAQMRARLACSDDAG